MTQISFESIVCQSQNQVSTQIDGEVVLMNIEKGAYFGLNKVLSRIWQLIESPISVSQICETLQKEYEVAPDVCRRDVLASLEKLADSKLISIA